MLNQVILVGQVSSVISFEDSNTCKFTLSISKQDPDISALVIKDTFTIQIDEALAERISEHVVVGDTLGIKGSLIPSDSGVKIYADKITFISSKNKGGNK